MSLFIIISDQVVHVNIIFAFNSADTSTL